ncbi:MAG: sugar phosphate isomerase/epimerase [Provencibacterium sp.]|jgi:D-psicose/D-tagatose/L-ribulose 3-epimerase|nr:sugar phosphate isomerase/epimerase [Provencibacterium sp.]
MRIGITSIDQAAAAAKMGFDYLEVNASAISKLSEEEFEKTRTRIQESGLPAESCNVLFHDIQLLSEEGMGRVESYLRDTFGRLQRLGVKLAVFGSGGARRKPDELPFGEAWRRLCEVTRIIGTVAGEYGIEIAIEPLRCGETNMVNSVIEGAALAAVTNLPNVWTLADSYHMFMDAEPMEHIRTVGRLNHVHVALRDGRSYPTYADGQLRLFMNELHAIGYDGRITIEAGTNCFEHDAPLALATLRAL